MNLQVNGESIQVDDGINIEMLLTKLELNPQLVVVELNREILTSEHYSKTELTQGDTLEIVQFVGGG